MIQVSKDMQTISAIQRKIVGWLSFYDQVSYRQLYHACQELIYEESLKCGRILSRSLFYKIVFPLVKVGIIEYGLSAEGNTFFFLPHYGDDALFKRRKENPARFLIDDSEKTNALRIGKGILKTLPSVKTYVESLEIDQSMHDFKYAYDKYCRSLNSMAFGFKGDVGIYKVKDLPYFPYYIVDTKGAVHKINQYYNSFEEMSYACCYYMDFENNPVFSIDIDQMTLKFFRQEYIPSFLFRAMCMVDSNVLELEELYVGKTVTFHIPDMNVVKEVTRILKVK